MDVQARCDELTSEQIPCLAASHRLPLHALVSDGDIIGEVVRRQGSRVHILVGYVVVKWGRYGNVYEPVEYGYGNYGAGLEVWA